MYECRPPLYTGNGYEVREADRREVDWMIRRHYLGVWPGVVVATLGLYREAVAVGVIVFSLPPPETFVRYGGETWELGRLWVDDSEPRNTESWFIARAVRYVRRFHREVVALVSYADPSVGHEGIIYRASNWLRDGRTDEERVTPRFDYAVAGKRFSRRAHVPEGVTALRVPRVSKHRYWLPLRKSARPPADPRTDGVSRATGRVAGLVHDPFEDVPVRSIA
jgi:hypothetical protein